MIVSKEMMKSARNASSYTAVEEFYKFIENLDDDVVIITMKCHLNDYDAGSCIIATLCKFTLWEDGEIAYDDFSEIRMVWDELGKLISSVTTSDDDDDDL